MKTVLLASRPVDAATSEVTLSRDGIRFKALVPTALLGTDAQELLFETMADRQVAEHARLTEITRPGRLEREA